MVGGDHVAISKSQRIKLLRSVANTLADEEWSIIDLTLSQYDLPTQSSWSGDKTSYVLEMAKSVSDDSLIELAEHLDISIEISATSSANAAPTLQPAFWTEGTFRLFISHLAAHRKFAADVQDALENYGISAFVAHNDIEPTKEWQTEIEVALATCDGLAALLHDNFHASNWTDQEVGFAMGRGVPIFAVGLGQIPYGFIGKFQALNGNGKKPYELARELFNAIRKHKQTQQVMADVLVRLFEKSLSFDSAKARIGYLEDIENWKPSYIQRISDALESNGQISGAWGVPEKVKALVEKWKK